MYVKVKDDEPKTYSLEQLRQDNPETSFPAFPDEKLLAQWDVYPCTILPKPNYNSLTEKLSAASVSKVDKVWTQGWNIERLSLIEAEQNIRQKRDQLLFETDWVVIKATELGQPLPLNWVAYRQDLRDITSQSDFPYSVIWPTKPE